MRVLLLFLLVASVFGADADDPENTDTLSLVQLIDLKYDENVYRAVALRGPAVFNDLVVLLGQAKEERLSRIIGSLGALAAAHEELLPKIIPILRDACRTQEFWSISGVSAATDSLLQRAAPLVPDLIKLLDRADNDWAINVIWSLGKIGEPALPAAERLAMRFGGMDDQHITDALGQIGNGIAPILRELINERPLTVLQIIDKLRDPTPEILALVRWLLVHGNADVRALAVATWCKQEPDDLTLVVKTAATDPANPVRLAATKYLSHLVDQDAGPIALSLLFSDDLEVLANALWRIGNVGLPRESTTKQVLPFLSSQSAEVRRGAVHALGQFGSGMHGGAGFSDRVDDLADAGLRDRIIEILRPLLTDPQTEVINEVVTALGNLGLADPKFRRWLLDHVADKEMGWTCASILCRIRMTSEDIPALLAMLTDPVTKRREMAAYIARSLTPPDRRVTDAVIVCLSDSEASVRGSAAVTLGQIGTDAVHAYDALVKALDDSDRNTAGWAAKSLGELGDGVIEPLRRDLRAGRHTTACVSALGMRGIAAAAAIPEIIAEMAKPDANLETCLGTLSNIGHGSSAARTAALAHVRDPDSENGSIASSAVMAIVDIGLDEPASRILATLDYANSDYHAGLIFNALLPWPTLAESFLARNPVALHGYQVEDLIAGWAPASPATREFILRQPNLPLSVLALSGDIRYLSIIRAAKETAHGYGSSLIDAYARMLGDHSETTVKISTTDPGQFRPASAWPRVDRQRIAPEADGHGDGYTDIMVTGVVRLADGSHPKSIRFIGVNDRMLLGDRQENEEKRLLYHVASGRFALRSTVFAAYSSGKGKAKEAGPYQTGSLITRLMADRAKPLRVVFYDEMPDVEITVDPLP